MRYSVTPAAVALAVALAAGFAARSPQDRPPGAPDAASWSAVPPMEPDPMCARIAARTMARHLAAREVAEGRLTLAKAAALFRWLNAQPPQYDPWPGAESVAVSLGLGGEVSSGSWPWLQVILWVVQRPGIDPGPGGGAAERLRAEYRAARTAGRLGDLPPVSDAEGQALLERAAADQELVKAPH